MTEIKPKVKPLLRGYLHQEAFFITLGAGLLLILKSTNSLTLSASLIYSLSLLAMFGISALYHRPHWQPAQRAFMKRLDHSAIFIQIAGTFTPICLLALPEESGHYLLKVIWLAALAGIFQSIFWVKAPKYVTALFYVIMGWQALPYLNEMGLALDSYQIRLIVGGGIVYTIGALFYAFKKPNFIQDVFGYHELFHLFTIIGAGMHFVAIYPIIK